MLTCEQPSAENTVPAAPRKTPWGPGERVLESNQATVGAEADEYDLMVQRHSWLLNRPFVKLVAQLGPVSGKVLDIGTGPGWIPIELARRCPGWEFWALDVSEDMLARARRHAIGAGVARQIHLVPGSATALPFSDGQFDLVISHFALHHAERPEEFFSEAARVTRPGGRVVIKDLLRQPRWKAALLLAFSKHVLRYSPLQLQMYRESMAAGLSIAEVEAAVRKTPLLSASVRRFRGLDMVLTADRR